MARENTYPERTPNGAREQRRVQLVQHRRQHPVQQQVDVLCALRPLRLYQQPVRRLHHTAPRFVSSPAMHQARRLLCDDLAVGGIAHHGCCCCC
jgi:hypothetical protein